MNKQVLVIGLGKMGFNFCLNLLNKGYEVYGFDINLETIKKANAKGIKTGSTLQTTLEMLKPDNKIVLLSLQHGNVLKATVKQLSKLLKPNDLVLDTANAFYESSKDLYQLLKKHQIDYLDAGTSGGPSGALNGACMMVGGDKDVYLKHEQFLKSLCIKDGCLYTGLAGSGHFTKMVHNGIEYGMMQALAEGFQVLSDCEYEFKMDQLSQVAHLWNNGSVIRSWLVELCAKAFESDDLLELSAVVNATGEGLWTVQTALKQGTPVPVIAASLMARQTSQKPDLFANKVLAKLRQLFGGHEVKKIN